jgi:DNA-binding NarL/FixJ family response regulator
MDVELIRAIRMMHQGDAFVYSANTRDVFKAYLERGYDLDRHKQLSNMETQVLKLTAQGYASKEIGATLSISPSTADTYRMRS